MVSGYPSNFTGNSTAVTGLSAGTTYYYRLRTTMGSNSNAISSAYSASRSATTTASSVGGTAASDQTVYSGQNPADVSVSGTTGSVTKWQSSLDNLFNTYSDIAVANSTLLGTQIGALTQTTYIRAVVQNGTCPTANSSYLTLTVAQPLPIELLYLTGKPTEKGNLVECATATEQNNDYFTLFWSDNGHNFAPITRIPGAGNSVRNLEYQYLDETPSRGVNYYKLRQTDYDGKFEDSEIISVFSDKDSAPTIVDCRNVLGQKVSPDETGVVILTLSKGNTVYVVKKVNY